MPTGILPNQEKTQDRQMTKKKLTTKKLRANQIPQQQPQAPRPLNEIHNKRPTCGVSFKLNDDA